MLHKPKSSAAKASSSNLASVLYPRRVTYVLSALKIATGCGLVALGAVALYLKASYAGSAAGLWTGIIVVISGVLGAFSVRRNASRRAYVILFFAACVIAIVADVLVIIYAATGLARDSGFPGGFVRDQISGDLIPVSQVNIPAREMAMLANLLLIILGILEVIFTLPSFIICLREICYCYSDSEVLMAAAAVAGSAEQERKLLTKNFLKRFSVLLSISYLGYLSFEAILKSSLEWRHADLRAPRQERLALFVAQSAAAATTATSPSPSTLSPPSPDLLQQHVGISHPHDGAAPLHDVPRRPQRRRQSGPLQLGRQPQQAAVPERVGGVAIPLGAEVQVAGEDAKSRPPPPHCSTSQPLW